VELPTWLAALEKQGFSADALEQKLRAGTPPVIARIDHDRVVLDLRTVLSSQDPELLKVLRDI
jgi:L-seryl-tRNA(Ser) seleniumtransferase